jgi:spermidine synthase
VKPIERLGETRAPDGTPLALTRRDDEYMILASGKPLMTSRMHGSEDTLATLGCRDLPPRAPRVLIGGLGMGFTLRSALDLLPADALVVVAELVPAVVEWNRGPLGPLAGHPLDDPRVRIDMRDVGDVIRSSTAVFDAILLDVDNGPDAFTLAGNASLYGDAGIAAARRALKPGGALAVWATEEDKRFVQRLGRAGFAAATERVRARAGRGRSRHVIFVARAPRATPAPQR